MSYRLCFLANSVRPAGRKGMVNAREDEQEEEAEQLNDEELREVRAMMRQPKLYEKMVNSMAPAVYGHHDVKRGVSCPHFLLLSIFTLLHRI